MSVERGADLVRRAMVLREKLQDGQIEQVARELLSTVAITQLAALTAHICTTAPMKRAQALADHLLARASE